MNPTGLFKLYSSKFLWPTLIRPRFTSNDRKPKKDLVPKPLEEDEGAKLSECKLKIETDPPLDILKDIPAELLQKRVARISQPSKNVMQSGTLNIRHWELTFDCMERWENPLIGWCSNSDPLSNFVLNFGTPDEAIAYCEKNGWKWYVDRKSTARKFKVKSYAANFVDKRCRVSTK